MLKSTLVSLMAIALLSLLTDMVVITESSKKYVNFVLGAAILATLAAPLSTLFSNLNFQYTPPVITQPDSSDFTSGVEQSMKNYSASAAKSNTEKFINEHYPGISFSVRAYTLAAADNQICIYITFQDEISQSQADTIKAAVADYIGIKPANVNIYLSSSTKS